MDHAGGRVAIVMGSQSDWPTMKAAADVLDELEVSYEARITERPTGWWRSPRARRAKGST
jgi:phosphoribosylcarboxyaminoimidazole (NCAIR) mutase